MRMFARLATLTICLIALLAFSAHALPRLRRAFVTQYPKAAGTKLDACVTCHGEGTALNSYGEALKKANLKLLAIEKQDADGDGASNRAEIDALLFPGDAKDRPAKRGAKRDSTAKPDSAAKPDSSKR